MATYKEIHGVNIQYRDSDATAVEGDVWYNRSTCKLRMHSALGSWASGNALNAGRYRMGSAGTRDAAVAFGGNKDPGQANETEFYLFNSSQRGTFFTLGVSYGFGKGEAMTYSGRRR